LVNWITAVKVINITFIAVTGLVVLSGRVKSIPDPYANFHRPFEGSSLNANALATGLYIDVLLRLNVLLSLSSAALVKINYTYIGWDNSLRLAGEIKGEIPFSQLGPLFTYDLNENLGGNPSKTIRKASLISIGMIGVLFMAVNVAYVAVIPKEQLKDSGQLAAAAFFKLVRRYFLSTIRIRTHTPQ